MALCISASSFAATPEEAADFFEKRVRPILADQCYECHNADKGKTKGGLNLANREGWVKGGESGTDRKSTRLNSSHVVTSRMPSSA